MQRLRHRPDHFFYRGDRFAFHRHQDGATLGRLDPYAEGEQNWPLHSGRVIPVTAQEVHDITWQVHGIRLPATRPGGGSCNCGARLAAMEARIDALEASRDHEADLFEPPPAAPDLAEENVALRARIAELESSNHIDLSERPVEESPIPPPPSPAVVALEKMEALKAKVDGARVHPEVAALLTEGETPPDAIERLTPDEDALLDLGASLSEEALEEALRFIPRSAREKWMEGLHGTHADLRLKRGTDKENLHREAQVTRMMTLLGRVGEKR